MYSRTELARNGDTNSRMLAAVQAVMPPSVTVKATLGRDPAVATMRIGSRRLTARWIGRGGLREVRSALTAHPRPDLIVGSAISLQARAEASAAGVGWIDETGAAEIASGTLVVSRSGVPRHSPPPPAWTPVTLGVAEAVLCGVAATAAATAAATGHAESSTVAALAFLTQQQLLKASAVRGRLSGRHVADPDRLLDEYADAARRLHPKAELRCGVLWRDPLAALGELAERWDAAGMAWAATGAIGAALTAPYLTDIPTGEVYVTGARDPDLRNAAIVAGIEPIEGGRLILRPFPTIATDRLATHINGLRVAPWPRVYADLRDAGVRGEEAAEHLRDTLRG